MLFCNGRSSSSTHTLSLSLSLSLTPSEGDEVAALPADTTSPRGNKASTPRKSSTPGERRRRTIYIAGMLTPFSHVMSHVMHDVICFPGRPPWYDSHGQIAEAFVIGEVTNLAHHNNYGIGETVSEWVGEML